MLDINWSDLNEISVAFSLNDCDTLSPLSHEEDNVFMGKTVMYDKAKHLQIHES